MLNLHDDVTCRPAVLSPTQLKQTLSHGQVVILAVRKGSDEINHAVCAVSESANGVTLIDYPDLTSFRTYESLGESWDGTALIVGRASAAIQRREATWPWLLLPTAACAVGVAGAVQHWRSRKHVPATKTDEQHA